MQNAHGVSAAGAGGDLRRVSWSHTGERGELVRVDDGWVLALGDALYHLVTPSAKPVQSIYSTAEGLAYEARTVKVEGHFRTEPDSVVVLEGTGDVVIDGQKITVDDTTLYTADGAAYREGDTVTINGRAAKVAVVQQQQQQHGLKRMSSGMISKINASLAK